MNIYFSCRLGFAFLPCWSLPTSVSNCHTFKGLRFPPPSFFLPCIYHFGPVTHTFPGSLGKSVNQQVVDKWSKQLYVPHSIFAFDTDF